MKTVAELAQKTNDQIPQRCSAARYERIVADLAPVSADGAATS